MSRRASACALCLVSLWSRAALAHDPEPSPEPSASSSPEPSPSPEPRADPRYETTLSARAPFTAASASTIRNQDFELRPRTSPNDLLRVVPGLMAVQHQGGGKADQLFLRGFDADHGTDVAVFVDGIPINLPSHAHGQGFIDLHWIIPEAVERIDVVKGPYDSRYGDFATGGAVNLVTRNKFDSSSVALTVGGFPTLGCTGGISQCKLVAQERLVGVVAPTFKGWAAKLHPWIAAEIARDQGPFDNAMGLQRYNVFAKLGYEISSHTGIGIFVQAYGSGWRGSGQIPSREVDASRLSQFGAIDPSEGGLTQRQMVTAFLRHRDEKNDFSATVYFTRYRLSLWDNFTFFLRDPVLGDAIEQDDARFITGANLSYHRHTRARGFSFRTTVGAQLRYDAAHVDIWDVTSQDGHDRKRLGRHADSSEFRFGNNTDVDQLAVGVFVEEDIQWTKWLRSIVGLRADYLGFNVDDKSENLSLDAPATSGVSQKLVVSPKASLVFSPVRPFDIYLNFGMGFHSNDARISVQEGRVTPDGPVRDVVPRIYAGELGARYSYRQYFSVAAALWASYLERETVFVGDDAAFEPADPTRRYGVDVELRAQPVSWLYVDLDLAYANATKVVDGIATGLLALAPRLYVTAGITARWKGLRAGPRLRYLGERPAFDEDSDEYRALAQADPRRALTAPYVIFDLFAAYRVRWFEVSAAIQNLANAQWREAQFGNRSCTRDEVSNPANLNYSVCGSTLAAANRTGVPDVHYTPGVPFNLQLTVKAYF